MIALVKEWACFNNEPGPLISFSNDVRQSKDMVLTKMVVYEKLTYILYYYIAVF